MTEHETKSTGGLVGDAVQHINALVRNEIDLVRTEVQENLSRAGTAIGLCVAGAIVGLTALNVLAAALAAALTEAGIDAGWAALIVGVIFAAVAFGLISKGTSDLKLSSIAPSRTAENVKRDAQAVKEAYNAK